MEGHRRGHQNMLIRPCRLSLGRTPARLGWVSKHLLIGSSSIHYSDLKYLGVVAIINCTDTTVRTTPSGMRYLRLSIPDGGVPTIKSLIPILDEIREYDDRNESVFVHCKWGSGRSALVASAYLLRSGWTLSQTCTALVERCPWANLSLKQHEFLTSFDVSVDKHRINHSCDMPSNERVLEYLRCNLSRIDHYFRRNGVMCVLVSGSFGRGEAMPGASDIDLTVVTKAKSTMVRYFMERFLVGHFNATFPMSVSVGVIDLSSIEGAYTFESLDISRNSKAVWGVKPRFNLGEPPLWEGVRLIFNRMFEYIEARIEPSGNQSRRLAKFILAIGDADHYFAARKFEPMISQKKLGGPLRENSKFAQNWELSRSHLLTNSDVLLDELVAFQCFKDCLDRGLESIFGKNGDVEIMLKVAARRLWRPSSIPGNIVRSLENGCCLPTLHFMGMDPAVMSWVIALNLVEGANFTEFRPALQLWKSSRQPIIRSDSELRGL